MYDGIVASLRESRLLQLALVKSPNRFEWPPSTKTVILLIMPIVLLIFGIGLGGYALYYFLRRASKDQAQKLLLSVAIGLITLLIFVLILVGRLPVAAILAAVLIPLTARLYQLLTRGQRDE